MGRGINRRPQIWHDREVPRALSIAAQVLSDLISWCGLFLRPRRSLEAAERGVKPRRIDVATRVSLAFLSRCFAWRSALIVVRPETSIRWHRAGFRESTCRNPRLAGPEAINVVDVPQQSRSVRLLFGRDERVSPALRVHRHRASQSSVDSL